MNSIHSNNPLVSIITITLNCDNYIDKTIQSVLSQTYVNIEYIIIDGGSTDNTLNILNKYKNYISKIVSENDEGISDAFNKGIKLARGDWVNFLNAGDLFFGEDSVEKIMKFHERANILTGFSRFHNKTIPNRILRNKDPLYIKARISHQASFVKNIVFSEVGAFSVQYRVRMDYEFWLRALKKFEFFFLPEILVNYDAGYSAIHIEKYYQEMFVAINKHVKYPFLLIFYLKFKYEMKKSLLKFGLKN